MSTIIYETAKTVKELERKVELIEEIVSKLSRRLDLLNKQISSDNSATSHHTPISKCTDKDQRSEALP